MLLSGMRWLMAPCALANLAWLMCSQACLAAAVVVNTHREEEVLVVEARADLGATNQQAWGVLTDYAHLHEFVPDLAESRVTERTADRVVVEQKGRAGFLFFRFSISLRMEIEERPPREILAKAVSGSFKEMTGRYELEPAGTGVKLHYTGRFVPNFGVPRFIGNAALKRAVERQFGAMVQEIERRAAIGENPEAGAPSKQ
ncbi:MAG: cyclase [Betaproteobacteria bacterium]|nr:cyclase [Betaproteobacteria bacterium]